MSEQINLEDFQVPAMTRRAAVAVAATDVVSMGSAVADEAVAQLVAQAAAKNAAFMRGDMQRWSELVCIAADFTLMQPFGGPPSRGFEASPLHMTEMARYFRNGKTDLELVQTYVGKDIVVLVMIERQTAEVGGLPEQDWSLRVTEVYQNVGSEWQLAHRHADPLLRHVKLEQVAAISRGLDVNQ